MNLACYVFDLAAGASLLRLVGRLNKTLDIQRIAIVYKADVDLKIIQTRAQKTNFFVKCQFIPYNGTNWEFAAYQLALDALSPNSSGLIVANDTAGRNYPFLPTDLAHFAANAKILAGEISPAILGKIETAGQTFVFAGKEFNCWVRSNIFYLNKAALDALQDRLFEPSIFNAPHFVNGQLRVGAAVSGNLESYVLRWLNPNSGKEGWLAHAHRSRIDNGVIRGKLGSILLEKYLAARLAGVRASFVSYEPDAPSAFYRLGVRTFFKIRRLKRLLDR